MSFEIINCHRISWCLWFLQWLAGCQASLHLCEWEKVMKWMIRSFLRLVQRLSLSLWVCVHMPLCVGGGRGCCLVKPRWPIFPAALISTVVDQRWWLAVGVTLLSVTIVTNTGLRCCTVFLSLLWMEDGNFSRACWTQGLKENLWISESTRCNIF